MTTHWCGGAAVVLGALRRVDRKGLPAIVSLGWHCREERSFGGLGRYARLLCAILTTRPRAGFRLNELAFGGAAQSHSQASNEMFNGVDFRFQNSMFSQHTEKKGGNQTLIKNNKQ